MRALTRIALCIVALVAAFVLLAPASLLDAPIASSTGERLRLADARGFWWRGHAVLATRDAPVRLPVAWRVALAPLLSGSLVVALQPEDGTGIPAGTLAIRKGALDVRDLHLVAPAAIVPAFVPSLSPIALRGDIDARAASFAWRRDSVSGTLDATWQPASVVAGLQSIALGRVVIDARPSGNGIAATLRNAGGDLAIDGSASLQGGAADASLRIAPTDSASAALRAMLKLMGPADPSGAVTLTWRSERH